MSLDLNTQRLFTKIQAAVVGAVNSEIGRMEEEARRMAPVRKIFSSAWLGKMTKTRRRRQIIGISTAQLNAEVGIRSRLGLGPRVPGVIGHELNVTKRLSPSGDYSGYRQVVRRTLASEMLDESWYSSLSFQQRRSSRSGKRLDQLRKEDLRVINEFGHLNPTAERHLTARGRYELKHARARGAISRAESGFGRANQFGKPRLGGRLRSEITATRAVIDGYKITGSVVSPTPYAKYVEFGTHHAPAQPYMRPAANLARRRFRQTLQRSLDDVKRTNRRASR